MEKSFKPTKDLKQFMIRTRRAENTLMEKKKTSNAKFNTKHRQQKHKIPSLSASGQQTQILIQNR
jgi:hypothetical protein